MNGEAVTLRYAFAVGQSPEKVTQRYLTSTPAPLPPAISSISTLTPGIRIAERYELLSPWPESAPASGEAALFQCRDIQNPALNLVLKKYHAPFRPDPAISTQLQQFRHPHIVPILAAGDWQGQYYEVMEYYAGGSLLARLPLHELALRDYLPPILSALQFCHHHHIIHGDVKPSNFLLKNQAPESLALADFGISSRWESTGNHLTHLEPATLEKKMTLDYAAPEFLSEQLQLPTLDYYALGITLLHSVLGHSPFQGMSERAIMMAHLKGRLPITETLFSQPFLELIQGLCHLDYQKRWGYREIVAWLHGEKVKLTAPPSTTVALGHPYPGFPAARHLKELAAALPQFNAFEQLQRGDIRRWVFDYFAAETAEKIDQIAQRHAKNAKRALVELRYILDPQAPLQIDNLEIYSLAQLAPLLADDNAETALYEALQSHALISWLQAGQQAGERTSLLVAQLEAMMARVGYHRAAAIVALRYILDPTQPFLFYTVNNKQEPVWIRHPQEIPALFAQAPRPTLAALQKIIFNRCLEEWLRAAPFANGENDARFIENCRQNYLENKAVGTYCVLWYWQPTLPFPVGQQLIHSPKELVQFIDQTAENTQTGLRLLQTGWIRAWLVGSRQIADPVALDHLLLALDVTWEAKLEALLQWLDPSLPKPELAMNTKILNFYTLTEGESREHTLTVINRGRGHLSGSVTQTQYLQGLTIDPYKIEGPETRIKVRLNSLGLMPGCYENQLLISTNGGDAVVKISYTIQEAPDNRPWWEKLIDRI